MAGADSGTGRARRIIGNALIAVGAGALLAASAAKIADVPAMVDPLNADGFTGYVGLLAVVEIVSAATFAIPVTRALGLLLVSSFLGGAVATHLQHGLNPAPPALLLGACWVGVWLRDPIVLWSFVSWRDETSVHHRNATGTRRASAT